MTRLAMFALPLGAFVLLGLVFFAQLQSGRQARDIESVLIGHAAPRISIPPVEGRDAQGFDTASLTGGRPSVVNFWATWCGPCKIEHPHLLALKARGATVHGVLYRDKPESALAYLKEYGDPFGSLGNDAKGMAGIEFGITGVPETFVIDARGVVVERIQGPLDADIVKRKILPHLGVQN